MIPTHNRWALLPRAVASTLAQAGVRVEVIVVDDASDEDSSSAGVPTDRRVSVVRRQRWGGVAAARNTGLDHSAAPWIVFLNDDDLWAPWRLSTMRDAAERAGASFAYSSGIAVDTKLRPLYLEPGPDPSDLAEELTTHNAIPAGGSNVLIRTSLLRDLGGFDERFTFVEDWELWVRLAEAAMGTLVYEPLVAYCHHAANAVTRGDQVICADVHRLAEKHSRLAPWLMSARGRVAFDRYLARSLWWSGHRAAAARRYLKLGLRDRDIGDLARAPAVALLTPEGARRLRLRSSPPAPDWLLAYATNQAGSRTDVSKTNRDR